MLRYVGKRLLYGFLVLLGVVTLVFFLFNVLPGDPARMILGVTATPEQLAALRHNLGLDQPFLVQLGTYMKNLFFHLDMGLS